MVGVARSFLGVCTRFIRRAMCSPWEEGINVEAEEIVMF
jgi:hypothetical protein